jgi:hypothetical protein
MTSNAHATTTVMEKERCCIKMTLLRTRDILHALRACGRRVIKDDR